MYVLMHACMLVCMYVCMYMYNCICICMYDILYVLMYALMHLYMYAWVFVYMYACTSVCMYVCMFVCLCNMYMYRSTEHSTFKTPTKAKMFLAHASYTSFQVQMSLGKILHQRKFMRAQTLKN